MKTKVIVYLLLYSSFLCSEQPQNKLSAQEHINQGIAHLQQNNKAIALDSFEQALELEPDNLQALRYIAATLYYSGKYYEACSYFRQCLNLNPTHAPSQYSLAIALSTVGEFDQAQQLLESLHDKDHRNKPIREQLLPIYIRNMDWYYALKLCLPNHLWWHDKDISNKKILLDVSSDQNDVGDVIHMIRYAKHLAKSGAHVTVKANKLFHHLFNLCPYIEQVIEKDPLSPYDQQYQLCMNTFILRMRETVYELSKDIPYLYADEILVEEYESKVKHDSPPHIGISWKSNQIKDGFTDVRISDPCHMQLAGLMPLFSINGINLHGLTNKEQHAIERLVPNHTPNTFDSISTSGPLMATAAIIENMDLIITVDNYVAHLAGAMGIPVWLLLPKAADCRWFADRNDSPWYPTVRIFQQENQGEWGPVIQAVKSALEELIQ